MDPARRPAPVTRAYGVGWGRGSHSRDRQSPPSWRGGNKPPCVGAGKEPGAQLAASPLVALPREPCAPLWMVGGGKQALWGHC